MMKMMKSFILAMLLAAVMAGAASAYNLNFTIYNESGWTFKQIWVSPHGASKWNGNTDRVNVRPLRSGYNIRIDTSNSRRMRNNTGTRKWDIRVYYGDDSWHQWRDIDLSRITQFWVDSDFDATWD